MKSTDFWLQRCEQWRWIISRWVKGRGWVMIFEGSEREARYRLRKIIAQID